MRVKADTENPSRRRSYKAWKIALEKKTDTAKHDGLGTDAVTVLI